MPVSPISALMAQTASNIQPTSSSAIGGFGEGDFMALLMAQLKNQNPMEPMDDKDLMGQVTQLNTLRELQAISQKIEQMNKSSQASYASSLIGKHVKTTPEDGSESIDGIVDGMEIAGGEYLLTIDDQIIRLSDVTLVKEQEE